MRRRVLWLFTLWTIFAAVLTGRLFVITTFPGTIVSHSNPAGFAAQPRAMVDLEHLKVIQTDDARGRVLFRNGLPWSGTWTRRVPANALAVGVHREAGTAARVNPVVGQVGLPDVWPARDRVVAEQGRSGLEYTFDSIVRGRRPGYLGVIKDAKDRIHPNAWYHIHPIPGVDVRTTIDFAWQQAAETALRSAGVEDGAVVVLDAATHQALAVAGVDRHNPRRIPAVRSEVPGSVFKIVTAAAALESYQVRTDTAFECRGRVDIPGVHMKCWARHGAETFLQAFANSCDAAFATIGVKLPRVAFEEMSRRLHLRGTGLQEVDGYPVLSEAERVNVFSRMGDDAGLLANTAIGQEDVRISPMVAANLACVIAQGGLYKDVQLVLDAERSGRVVRSFATSSHGTRAISPYAANRLAAAMRLVVTSSTGTAHDLADLPVSVAAKTGTAELGRTGLVNGWMVGFAPYEHPRIAFCVFVGRAPSQIAHHAVHQVTRTLINQYAKFEACA